MQMFDPQNLDFESAVRESFDHLTLMRTIGATLERVSPGEVEIALPFRTDLTQHHGFMAAAVLTAVTSWRRLRVSEWSLVVASSDLAGPSLYVRAT